MTGRDFLIVAEDLIGAAHEAAWRSATSRAYYAAFHVARELLQNLGFAVPRADRAHAYLWLRLSNCGDVEVQLAGQELNDLRGDRNRADYDVKRPHVQSSASGQVRVAERIIQILDTAVVEPKRKAIRDSIRIYERDVLHDVTWQP